MDRARYVTVIIHDNKAYVPVNAIDASGPFYVAVPPIFQVELRADDLASAIDQAVIAGHPPYAGTLPVQSKQSPLLAVMRISSWRKLAREAATYSIEWADGSVALYLHNSDRRGVFIHDPSRVLSFPPDVPLAQLASSICDDATELAALGFFNPETPWPRA